MAGWGEAADVPAALLPPARPIPWLPPVSGWVRGREAGVAGNKDTSVSLLIPRPLLALEGAEGAQALCPRL